MGDLFERANNISVIAGFKSFRDFNFKLTLPIMVVAFVASFILLKLKFAPTIVCVMIPVFGLLYVIQYPFAKYSQKEKDIHEHLHFFITYAGTIATMNISRGQLFKRIAEKKVFGEIGNIFEKILYLSKGWNMGFANSCRKMSKRCSSQILRDFLDRFAVIMDFGQDLQIFLYDEQKAVFDDFEVEYRQSLEKIKLLQEIFISFSIAFAFVISIAMLAPLLMDYSLIMILLYALIAFIVVESFLMISIKTFIPSEKLFIDSKKKNAAQKVIRFWFFITLILSIAVFISLTMFFDLTPLLTVAITVTPLIIPGFMAINEEAMVVRRDRQFPVYARVLGSAIEVRNGGVISALKSTQVHDFGVLNKMSINLHKRLRLGCNKFMSWYFFAMESGSNLIHHFSKIFSESVYLGGDANKIGEIVSKNMLKIISLKKLREQLSRGLSGAFYSSLIGLTATLFVTMKVSQMLINIFNRHEGMEEQMFSFISSILPQTSGIDFTQILFIMSIFIIFHAWTSSFILKIIDGGTMYAALVDFVVMMWIAALLSWILPIAISSMLPDFSGILSSTSNMTVP